MISIIRAFAFLASAICGVWGLGLGRGSGSAAVELTGSFFQPRWGLSRVPTSSMIKKKENAACLPAET